MDNHESPELEETQYLHVKVENRSNRTNPRGTPKNEITENNFKSHRTRAKYY